MDDPFGLIDKVTDDDVKRWLMNDPKNFLLYELRLAELEARKGGKRKTHDTHAFEANLYENLVNLRDDLWNYEYKPSRSTAHIINNPVKREIFAAPYRDRVVQHFIVSNIEPWWEPRLIYDSYSCRKGKGTLFGIRRLAYHIKAVSECYKIPAYVVKMDISGYFMHIRRDILYKRVIWGLERQFRDNKNKRYYILKNAISEIIFDDPVDGVRIQGSCEDWRDLPSDKSLLCQKPGLGIVIGNLTSQFFSNVFLDMLDRYVKIDLGYKHYGRYVDDFYIVVREDELDQAMKDVRAIGTFLEGIGLSMNLKKTRVIPIWQGVPFLGAVVKNDVIMPDKRLTKNFRRASFKVASGVKDVSSVASYLGMMKHYKAGKVIDKIFDDVGWERAY